MAEARAAATLGRSDLERAGFAGFFRFGDLQMTDVPTGRGVYVVLRDSDASPSYRVTSAAGRFKNREPSVDKATLRAAWVEGEEVLYIGKAAGGPQRGLRKRLDEYRRHGSGLPVGHWGGRYVWQLEDSDGLLVAWRATAADEDPGVVESRMFAEFHDRTGSLPFANLRH